MSTPITPRLSCEPPLSPEALSRLPAFGRSFLLLVVLVSGLVTIPQAVTFGETSGLGVWTTLIGGGVWLLWVFRPYYPRELSRVLAPLLLFGVYATLSLTWGGVSVKALQNLAVSVGFAGFVLLAARECECRPGFAFSLHRALDAASLTAALAYTVTVALYGQGADAFWGDRPLFMARPFALFSAVAVARQLARWQAGDRRGFWVAAWLVALVFLSQSRLCMVACLALFPLAMCCRGDGRSILRAGLMAVVAAAVLAGSIFFSQSMYERFFGYDANLSVGGVNINSSGRAEMWQALIADLHGPAVWFGHGAGGAGRLIDLYFPGLGHPHNDFLRFLYDFGALGLGCWVAFLVAVLWTLAVRVRKATRVPCPVAEDDGEYDDGGDEEGGEYDAAPAPRPRWQDHPDLPLHLTPLLALVAIIASMFTDNSVSYVFVMAPLGMLIGASLSRLRPMVRTPTTEAPTTALAPVTPAGALPAPPGARVLYMPEWESRRPAPGRLVLPNWEAASPPGRRLVLPNWEASLPRRRLLLPNWGARRPPGPRLVLPNWEADEPPAPPKLLPWRRRRRALPDESPTEPRRLVDQSGGFESGRGQTPGRN